MSPERRRRNPPRRGALPGRPRPSPASSPPPTRAARRSLPAHRAPRLYPRLRRAPPRCRHPESLARWRDAGRAAPSRRRPPPGPGAPCVDRSPLPARTRWRRTADARTERVAACDEYTRSNSFRRRRVEIGVRGRQSEQLQGWLRSRRGEERDTPGRGRELREARADGFGEARRDRRVAAALRFRREGAADL